MNRMKFLPALALLVLGANTSCDQFDDFLGGGSDDVPEEFVAPIIIAHRGAQSVLPEHTLEAYKLGIEQGADFIEPDLVMTKDSVLIARHEPFLSGTTDVADRPEFADRMTTKNLDGRDVTDWFSTDFTLDEIKTLRARRGRSDRPDQFDDMFEIPTFTEIIQLAQSMETQSGNAVGIYPEIKHPLFHNDLDLPMEDTLLRILRAFDFDGEEDPIFVQCFEVAPLQYINERATVKLVQLISTYDVNADGSLNFEVPDGQFVSFGSPYDFAVNGDPRTYEFFTTAEGMQFTASYADGIGPWKPFIIPFTRDADGTPNGLLPATNFIDLAHENDLLVHPYTFRNEDERWSGGNPEAEYHLFFDAGVDGVFTDYVDEAVGALSTYDPEN